MSMSDPIADFLTRIRNAQMAKMSEVVCPSSKIKMAISEVLESEGYIDGFAVQEVAGKQVLNVGLKYFRGLNPKAFDGRGNYAMGVSEQIIFPEIDYDKIDKLRGLDITITTTARDDEEGRALLSALRFPFRGMNPQQSEAKKEEAPEAAEPVADIEES